MEGYPLVLFFLGLGIVRGHSPESESQQVVATSTPNAKQTNKTGEIKKSGVGRQTKTESPDLLPRAEGPASSRGWGPGLEGLAGPALHLALRAVLVIRGPGTSTAQARDPVAHVEQHHLQRVCIHAPLVGLRSTLHIFHDSACEVFTLWSGVPEPHNRIDAAGGQEAVAGVWLQAVDNGLIPLEHTDQVGGLLFPDEEGAIVRATDDILSVAGGGAKGREVRWGTAL